MRADILLTLQNVALVARVFADRRPAARSAAAQGCRGCAARSIRCSRATTRCRPSCSIRCSSCCSASTAGRWSRSASCSRWSAVIINTLDGLSRIPRAFVRTAAVMRLTPRAIALHIILPAAAPWLFTGAKFAVAYSFIGVIAGEFVRVGRRHRARDRLRLQLVRQSHDVWADRAAVRDWSAASTCFSGPGSAGSMPGAQDADPLVGGRARRGARDTPRSLDTRAADRRPGVAVAGRHADASGTRRCRRPLATVRKLAAIMADEDFPRHAWETGRAFLHRAGDRARRRARHRPSARRAPAVGRSRRADPGRRSTRSRRSRSIR